MKANELRIGNWVDADGEITFVRNIYGSSCDVNTERSIAPPTIRCIQYKHLKPIPLTEEWLIKFGFEWDGAHYRSKKFIDKKGDERTFTVHYSTLDGYWIAIATTITYLEYVHHLQNAFALTGEELILTP